MDGISHEPSSMTEDYPLHPSRIETQLVVGACWQGNGRWHLSPQVSGIKEHLCSVGVDRLLSALYPPSLLLFIPLPKQSLSGDMAEAAL